MGYHPNPPLETRKPAPDHLHLLRVVTTSYLGPCLPSRCKFRNRNDAVQLIYALASRAPHTTNARRALQIKYDLAQKHDAVHHALHHALQVYTYSALQVTQ